MKIKKRDKATWIVRGVTLLIVIAIAVLMFIIGRGHTIYFDNKPFESAGDKIEAPYKVEVLVGGEKVARLKEGERGMVETMGQSFDMQLVITKEKNGKSSKVKVSLPIPYNMDGVVINLPAMLAGKGPEDYMTEFVPTPSSAELEDEEVVTDETEGLMDFGDE
ncbi:DUF6672 family protein [Butyrivibrio sp. MC2013]|uniref:DUF6672 family protein n=1 Tax=Butyrivibrio sp. MC2013 TaxID=1280686 RepID=UPI000423B759|nr:DUF6672 family protein [Butyrivibrio sp. MC2013]